MISPKDRNVRRRIPIRIKLAAALAIPITALLLVSLLEVAQSNEAAAEIKDQTDLATASIGPGGLITALQNERNFGAVWLLGFDTAIELPVDSNEQATAATDQALADFRAEIDKLGGDVAATYEPAMEKINAELAGLRDDVTDYQGERGQNNTAVSEPFYLGMTDLIDTMFQANSQVALAVDDSTLRRGVELTDLATREIENASRIIRVFLLAGVNGEDGGMLNTPEEIGQAAGLLGQYETNMAAVNQLSIGRYEAPAQKVLQEIADARFVEIARQGLAEAGEQPVRISEFTNSVSREDDEGWNGFRTAVNDEIEQRAAELNDQATRNRQLYLALAAVAIVVALLVTWLVSRSITRPLRSLTRQAKEMAERRLPEAVIDILETPLGDDVTVPTVDPVRVNTRDEVSDVADALNTVQDSALDLAVEQAVLRRNIADSFVNLGRRNQNLLGRQLDFITELETNETDADTLANLFRLDHLATRMRRNAESLLVLAGIDPPRQWAAPVRLTDVIRAALGEVEDYQRVTVRGVEPATIIGSAAADLAHLLAELIENALVFSPPDQTVDIRGRNRPDGYTLAIIDSGLGMPASDVAAANRRLAGAESFTIAPSKYLGHYVAGNLAARHDIHVHLDNSPGNGITATIELPQSLLTSDAPLGEAVPPNEIAPAVGPPLNAAPPPPPRVETAAPRAAATTESPWAALDLPPAAAPMPPAPTAMPPAARAPQLPQQTRTASGLVKRARRGGESEAPAAAVPEGELLASLSNVTDNLSRSPAARGYQPPMPPPDPTPPAPLWSALSSRHQAPAEPLGPAASPPPGPPPAGGDGRGWTVPPEGGDGRGWTVPPQLLHPGTPPASGGAAGGGAAGGGAAGGGAAGGGDPGAGGQTAGGLTRRVRGAQLPATQPLSVRRAQEPPSRGDGGYRRDDHRTVADFTSTLGNGNGNGNGSTNGHTNGRDGAGGDHESSAARDVYGFLTSFTQGVQRGLDEARRAQNIPKENS
jgi:signal transduction histidine kinase